MRPFFQDSHIVTVGSTEFTKFDRTYSNMFLYFLRIKLVSSITVNFLSCRNILFSPKHLIWLTLHPGVFTTLIEGLIVTAHYMVLKLMALKYCITQTKFMVSKPRQTRTNSSQSNQFHSYNTSNSRAYRRGGLTSHKRLYFLLGLLATFVLLILYRLHGRHKKGRGRGHWREKSTKEGKGKGAHAIRAGVSVIRPPFSELI